MIPLKITKEEVNAMELGAFPGKIVLVDNKKAFLEMEMDLYQQRFIGFDTETRPAFRRGVSYDVALLQLSTPETAYLIRLNEWGLPSGAKAVLEDPHIVKIGAAVRDDIKALKKMDSGFQPDSFFDLNEELKKVGFLNVGV
ncbi:MAG: 3'-5' exonuclease domain-containing protein 2, partial [Cyclobacteriaceae bacterium]